MLEAWLVLTSVKYHGNLYILIPLNQWLALTRLRATGPRWIEIYSVYQVTSIRFPHADDAQIVYDASSETQGAVSRRARRKNSSTFSSVGGRGLPLVLENFRRAFSPGPTGSLRMDSTRLKERLRGTL